MNRGLKKTVVLGLSAGLVLTSLAGCAKKEKFDTEATAITVNDSSLSVGVVNFAVRYNQAGYESLYMSLGLTDPFSQDMYGTGVTLGDDLKSMVADSLTDSLLAEQKMEEYEVTLTDEEKASVTAAASAFIEGNEAEVLENLGATQEIVERYLELELVKTKMEAQMSADVNTEVSDEEAAQREVQYVLFTPVTDEDLEAMTESETETVSEAEAGETEDTAAEAAKTEADTEAVTEEETAALTENEDVKTKASDETETETEAATEAVTEAVSDETEEDGTEAAESESEMETEAETETETEDPEAAEAMERARVQAEEMLAKLAAGSEFDAAAEEMGKTATTTKFGADYSIAELVTATDGLADGTLVETPVETANGYYVVKVLSEFDREATDEKKETIVSQRKSEQIQALYTEWSEAGEIKVDEEVMATIQFDYHLTQPTEAATEAVTEAASEAMTETVSEAGTEAEAAGETETEAVTEAETAGETETETVTEAAETAGEAETEAAETASEAETEAVTE